jgi:two-component system sensor histidine kinase FlrB
MATAQIIPTQEIPLATANLHERSLAEAFAVFSKAAASLENSYKQLQSEVARLRQELAETNRDLAASLEENQRLQQEHEMLRRRQALAELSATLAHEIRNPLGSLELFAGLLAESELDSEKRNWVEHLQAGLRTLAATVNNVLQFHSQPQPGLAPTDLGQLLRSLGQFLRPLAQRSKVHLEVVPSPDGTVVAADRHRLEQVLLNLALNSFQSMPSGGVLRIAGHGRSRDGGNKICIEVADTGPGIAPENLQRIFEPGFTTRASSAGLGLAVCKTIMEQHGGSIEVSSRPSRGSTFTLQLPVPLEANEPRRQ